MRLLGIYTSTSKASEVCGLLESRGIPTYGGISAPSWRLVRFAVYVCIESQYEDARKLLADRDHKVSDPIDVVQFNRYIDAQDHSILLKWSVVTFFVVVCALALLLAILTRWDTGS